MWIYLKLSIDQYSILDPDYCPEMELNVGPTVPEVVDFTTPAPEPHKDSTLIVWRSQLLYLIEDMLCKKCGKENTLTWTESR